MRAIHGIHSLFTRRQGSRTVLNHILGEIVKGLFSHLVLWELGQCGMWGQGMGVWGVSDHLLGGKLSTVLNISPAALTSFPDHPHRQLPCHPHPHTPHTHLYNILNTSKLHGGLATMASIQVSVFLTLIGRAGGYQ